MSCNIEKDGTHNHRAAVRSVAITDYAIDDTSLQRCVLVEVDTLKLKPLSIVCNGYEGVIHLGIKDSLNLVFDIIHECRRTFPLESIEVPDCMQTAGCRYFKIDFNIFHTYDTEMILKVYTDYLLKDWVIHFYDTASSTVVKSKDFKVSTYDFCRETVVFKSN